MSLVAPFHPMNYYLETTSSVPRNFKLSVNYLRKSQSSGRTLIPVSSPVGYLLINILAGKLSSKRQWKTKADLGKY